MCVYMDVVYVYVRICVYVYVYIYNRGDSNEYTQHTI